ncbi:hypothetical protein chiPu_0016312 [Chiloscyllium punctatum]|uniref:Uncharacterized protein n=1 Tax=Chiloscyllium punctatum TaxID=137246 RepID=A0A401T593_CHIPU|nr:hypothetical protein [Chiloscyllium punctatum]
MVVISVCVHITIFNLPIIAFDELRKDLRSPIDQCNPLHARERLRNIERICYLLRRVSKSVKECDIYGFPAQCRYFHNPTDSNELMYDPVTVMNDETLNYCQKEAWCKMSFYLMSFFYYLYCMIDTLVSI